MLNLKSLFDIMRYNGPIISHGALYSEESITEFTLFICTYTFF